MARSGESGLIWMIKDQDGTSSGCQTQTLRKLQASLGIGGEFHGPDHDRKLHPEGDRMQAILPRKLYGSASSPLEGLTPARKVS